MIIRPYVLPGNDGKGVRTMPRFAVDLNTPEGRHAVGGQPWRVAPGLVPGEPNEGLSARLLAAPPRLSDYGRFGMGRVRQRAAEPFRGFYLRLVPDCRYAAGVYNGVNVAATGFGSKRFRQLRRSVGERRDRPGRREHRRPEHAPTGWKSRRSVSRERGT